MSKMEDAILGFAIGDALGVPYEFKKRDTFLCADMIGYGTHHKPAGTWSDDTSMTLATLDSLKAHSGKIVTEDIRTKFNYWLLYGDYTTDGDVFDAGVTTCTALKKGKPAIGEWTLDFRGSMCDLCSCCQEAANWRNYIFHHSDASI